MSRTDEGWETRQRLLEAGERLFAADGVRATSAKAITVAASQKNNSALQYHFGSKDGLLRALLAQTLKPLLDEVYERLDGVVASGSPDLRSVSAAFVEPFAARLTGTPRERNFLIIFAEVQASGKPGGTGVDAHMADFRWWRGGFLSAYHQLNPQSPPAATAVRLRVVMHIVLQALAVLARQSEEPSAIIGPDGPYVRHLVEFMVSVMSEGSDIAQPRSR